LPISTKTLNGNDHITLLLFCFAIDPTSNITKPLREGLQNRNFEYHLLLLLLLLSNESLSSQHM
jgi:hypothetical protein